MKQSIALSKKALRYFDVQRKKKSATCTVLIDAHGSEELEMNCNYDNAIVYSLSAGILGSAAYANKIEGTEDSDTLQHLEIMKQYPLATTETIHQKASEIASAFKPIHAKKFKEKETDDFMDKWGKKHYEKYGLTKMRQMLKKKYHFYHNGEAAKMRGNFKFGVYITDISYPPDQAPSKKLEDLRGRNIISCDFMNETEYPLATQYLHELSQNRENVQKMEKPHLMDNTCLAVLSFDELIQLLYKLGFEYSYIFDYSCRSHPFVKKEVSPTTETKELFEKWAIRERRPSLVKHSGKMKSAETLKRRKISTSRTFKSKNDKRVKSVKKLFYSKIIKVVEDIIYDIDFDYSLNLIEEPREENKIILKVNVYDLDLFRIEFFLDFLKIKDVVISKDPQYAIFMDIQKEGYDSETIQEMVKKFNQFTNKIKSLHGKTFRGLEPLLEHF
jgi:hypothetical protein